MTDNRVAVVTGGAGGIGSVICAMLARQGYRVVVADANEQRARDLAGQHGGHAFAGDLTTSAANRELVGEATALGTLSVLVNAVGISPKAADGRKKPFYDVSEEEWDQVLAVNLKAPFLLAKYAYEVMPTDGTASIVNLLSITSKLGTGGLPDAEFPPFLPSSVAYAASKAGLQNLTASLARELAGRRIRVNGVAPGLVATAMTGAVPDKDQLSAQVPIGRFARPDEVVGAIEFLISDRASYITGSSVDINGGWLTC